MSPIASIRHGSIHSTADMVKALEILLIDGFDQAGSVEERNDNHLIVVVDDCDETCESSEYVIEVMPLKEPLTRRLAAAEKHAPLLAAVRASGLSIAEVIAWLRQQD
jgi:hypothetical protein